MSCRHRQSKLWSEHKRSGAPQKKWSATEQARMVLQDGVAETTILQLKQSLPVEMKMFWGSSSYKMQLKQIFTEWIAKSYKGSRPLFLGGENKDDVRFCVMIADGDVSFQPPLK